MPRSPPSASQAVAATMVSVALSYMAPIFASSCPMSSSWIMQSESTQRYCSPSSLTRPMACRMVLGMTTGVGRLAEKAPGRQKASRVAVVNLAVSTWPHTYDKAQYLGSPGSWAGETRHSWRTSINQVGGEPNLGYSVHS